MRSFDKTLLGLYTAPCSLSYRTSFTFSLGVMRLLLIKSKTPCFAQFGGEQILCCELGDPSHEMMQENIADPSCKLNATEYELCDPILRNTQYPYLKLKYLNLKVRLSS